MGNEKERDFERLFRYYPAVLAFMKRSGFSPDEARDLAQDVFTRVYEYMDAYRGQADWAYVKTVARTVALNEIRSRSAQKRAAILEPEDRLAAVADRGPAPDADYDRRRLYEAVERLDDKRKPCMLLYLAGFPYREIEQILGIRPPTLKSRLHEARNQLRDMLGEDPGEFGDES